MSETFSKKSENSKKKFNFRKIDQLFDFFKTAKWMFQEKTALPSNFPTREMIFHLVGSEKTSLLEMMLREFSLN